MRSLQKMQTLRFCFFCQPFSSFSFLGLRPRALACGIQRCLLVPVGSSDGDRRGPIAATRAALALDLRRRPTQARPDLVGLDLHHGALVALLRLPGAHLQATRDDDTRPARQRLRDVLRERAPGVDGEVRRLAVLPVARLVLVALVDRDAELHNRGAVRRVAQLGIVREVSRDDDLVVARHLHHLPILVSAPGSDGVRPGGGSRCGYAAASPRTTTLNRITSSASRRIRSSSMMTPGSAVNSTTT